MKNYLLTSTCVGIHPGRVDPASPIALTTSRREALQPRRFCESSLDTFIQSFLLLRVVVICIGDVSWVVSTPRSPVPASTDECLFNKILSPLDNVIICWSAETRAPLRSLKLDVEGSNLLFGPSEAPFELSKFTFSESCLFFP